MLPLPPLAFATPRIDIDNGNDIWGLVLDGAHWFADRVVKCSLIFYRESAYDHGSGVVDPDATAFLLANNSLHYGRTADIEHFLVAYDDTGVTPVGLGFGSYGAPQSWTHGLGITIKIPQIVPAIGGRQFVTFQDDMPLMPSEGMPVFQRAGLNYVSWDALEAVSGERSARRLYVSTPNHLFDFVNRNPGMDHVDQLPATRRFNEVLRLPSETYANADDWARLLPDESRLPIRNAVRAAAQLLFRRAWLF